MSALIETKLKNGSVLGGMFLVAGCCIGAGMLALPVITGMGGFLPSTILFLFAWLFMTSTGILLLEVNLAVGHNLSLISIADRTLGKMGKIFCWVLFLFLFYSLNTAYIAASGSVLQSLGQDLFGVSLPTWFGSVFFTFIFGLVTYFGTRSVDYLNRFLIVGLVIAYGLLVSLGLQYIQPQFLRAHHWKYAFAALPVLIISFGFHNMIPTLAHYLKGDKKRLRTIIYGGSSIPLLFYLLWEVVMLGIIPVEGREGLLHALDQGEAATEALRAVVGRSAISLAAETFALFAIITSFLAVSLSLVDFLADGLKISKKKGGRILLVLLTLFPPFLFAFVYPGIFIKALNLAGGFSAVILFGVMPVMMRWVVMKQENERMSFSMRLFLSAILISALGIFFLELAQELGFSLIPSGTEAV